MNLQECEKSCPLLRPCLTSKKIVLPTEIILYMANFLRFEDYQSFIRSLWPNNDESDVIQEKLWQLSTHQFSALFLNGRRIQIEYNFDRSRKREDCVLINVDYLIPVFGGVRPPVVEKFVSIPKLYKFIRMYVNLNMCSSSQPYACLCEMYDDDRGDKICARPLGRPCRHFHHYCARHIRKWLDFYLVPAVWFRETKDFFNANAAENFVSFLSDIIHCPDE